MNFFRPTHPLNLENSRYFFFELFLNNTNQIINQKIMTNHSFLQRMTPKLWMVKNVSRKQKKTSGKIMQQIPVII